MIRICHRKTNEAIYIGDEISSNYLHLEEYQLSWADFNNFDLSNSTFIHCNLGWASFNFANLSYTVFTGSNLVPSSFVNANLDHTNFNGCHLIYSDFRQSILNYVSFANAILAGANFMGCDLRSCNMSGIALRFAKYDQYTLWPEGINPVTLGAKFITSKT